MEEFNYNNDLEDPFNTGDFNLLPQHDLGHQGQTNNNNNNNNNVQFNQLEGQNISNGEIYSNGAEPNNDNIEKTQGDSPTKSKRKRAKGETLNILKREFNLNPSPTPQQRKDIAKLIGMPEKSVTIWFQNKRAKMKRKRLKEQNDAMNNGSTLTSPRQGSNRSMSNSSTKFRNNKNYNKQRRRKSKSKRRRFSSNNDNSSPMSNDDYDDDDDDDDDGYDDEEEDDYDEYDDDGNESAYSRSSSIMNDVEDEREINFFDRVPLDINKNYYFIDVCSITVGTWNRMKSGSILKKKLKTLRNLKNLSPKSINDIMLDSTDLIVLISKKNFEINYFFSAVTNNSKILFRIFYPIASVTNCSISLESDEAITNSRSNANNKLFSNNNENSTNKFSELKLTIDKSPNFAVYFLNENVLDTQNQWSICEDFSEGKQVNDAFIGGSNLPHILKGLQDSLRFMNSLILDYKATNQIIPPPPPPQPMHINHPQPQHEPLDISQSNVPLNPQDLDMAISMSVPLNDPLSFQSLPGQQTQQTNILFNDNKNLSYSNVPDNFSYSNSNTSTANNMNNNQISINHAILQHQDSNTSSSAYASSLQFDRGNNNIHYNSNNNPINSGLYDHDTSMSNHISNNMGNNGHQINQINNNSNNNSHNNNNNNGTNPHLSTHDLENINLTPNSFFFDNQDYLSNNNNNTNNSNDNNNNSNNNDQIYASLNHTPANFDNSNIINDNDIKNQNQKNNNLMDDTNQLSSNLHNLSPENYNGHPLNNNGKDNIISHNSLNQHTNTDFF